MIEAIFNELKINMGKACTQTDLKLIRELQQRGIGSHQFFVYCLVKETDDALVRLNTFRELHINPFVQPYRDFNASWQR